jgi:dolichol-phosphate mannosyltransferase
LERVAIVIPCLNEAANLESLLPQVHAVIAQFALPARIYVVDGGSSDGTAEVAARLGAQVLPQRGTGYGGAIKTAFQDLKESFLITLDADCSHHPAILGYLYGMRHRADIVIASRFVEQGHARMALGRRVLSGILNTVFRTVLSLPFRDLSSGYRLYRRGVVQALDLEYSTYAILQEILVKAYCEGFQIREIPFHYLPRRHGETHARLWRFGRDYLAVLRKMWRLRNGIESADYDNRAFNSRIPLQRYWQRKRYAVIVEYIGDHLRVLDTGCGSTQILNGAPQVIGCDILQRKLRFMRRPGRTLVRASTYEIPFRDEAFEVVISSQVIEHIPDTEGLFPELARVIEPGGVLILGTPDYGGWQWPLIEKAYGFFKPTGYADEHITHYTRDGLFARLTALGFTIEDHRYILGGELIIKARKQATEQSRLAEINGH